MQKATTSESENHKRERVIVRLKGGDPFLFGRARSEIDALRSAGVPYAYAPGISSCIAGPHLGGIPLTDASLGCQSFGVWSGTDAFGGFRGLEGEGDGGGGMGGGRRRRWSSGVDVLVFLMIGRLDKLDALCRCIVADHHRDDDGDCGDDDDAGGKGWNEDTPCEVIQNAGGARREGGGGGRRRIDDDGDVARPKGVEVDSGEHRERHQGRGSRPDERQPRGIRRRRDVFAGFAIAGLFFAIIIASRVLRVYNW